MVRMEMVIKYDKYWLEAWKWLKATRKCAPDNADIWHLRYHWKRIAPDFYHRVLAGRYRLTPMQIFNENAQWSAQDALVLKWVALQIAPLLPKHHRCQHLKGHGGYQNSIQQVSRTIQSDQYRYVLRTDIRGYYAAINKEQVLKHVKSHVGNPVLYDLIEQYVKYSVEQGGSFHFPERGICRGCALSPLLGGSFLYYIDDYFHGLRDKIFYARYMDDFLVMTRKRWDLRRCIATLNSFFDQYGFEKHPDKTQMGKLEQGFDWLGVYFASGQKPTISFRSIEKHRLHRLWLYEQALSCGLTKELAKQRVQKYDERWQKWTLKCLGSK